MIFLSKIGEEQSSEDAEDGPPELLVGIKEKQTFCCVYLEFLTKKLPTFLSRLNEISGGCEKILPVSGSVWSNLKLLRIVP